LIGARTERAARLAARQLGGGLSEEIGRCREEFLDLVASLEVALDFPEDEVGLGRSEATRRAHDLGRILERLMSNVRQGRAVQDGLSVMLAGAPNVGKSSLLNCLLGAERAIVSPMPGTTRDLVEGTLVIEGVPVRVVDGAGLGDALDSIDAEGMRRAKQALASADLVLVILDRSGPTSVHDRVLLSDTAGRDRLVVSNKCDLPVAWDEGIDAHCVCSALTGEGLPELSERLTRWVRERTASDGEERGIVASLRVLEGLRTVRLATSQAAEALARGAPYEAALVDLRDGQLAIEQILGIRHDDAVLDRIFASFCVGK
jgi:tRNA modification GTPase